MHTVQSAIVFYRLCPSVCPMPVLCPNECTYRHNFWHSGRGIIFFSHIAWQNSNRNPLSGDLKYTEVGKLRFSTKIAIYIENGTRYVHGYYGSLIGSHRWPIDPCQLRWPGLGPNLERRNTTGQIFPVDRRNYAYTVWPRTSLKLPILCRVGR